jgi:hypothetical protein
MTHDNIKTLVEAVDGLSDERKILFFQTFTGALSVAVTEERWRLCLEISQRVLAEDLPPAPPQPVYSPSLLKILRKQTSFKEVAKGNKRRRKMLRDIAKHGGSIGGIRIEKRGSKK